MRLKKNPNIDLNRKRALYFVLALGLILALIYIALEWKTDDDNKGYDVGSFPNKKLVKEDSTLVLETKANYK